MTLAEFGAVLTILCSTFTAAFVARNAHAGWWSLLFATGGFVLGLPLALASGKLALALLRRPASGVAGVFYFLLYLLLPLLAITAAVALVGVLAVTVLHHLYLPPAT